MFRRLLLMITISFHLAMTHAIAAETALPVFSPGQMWSIKSATTIKVVICKIEPWKNKIVIHVSILDAPVPNDMPGAGGMTTIGYMPFEEGALAASVDHILVKNASPAPNFENGYEQWKSAEGGIFTISVQQAIDFTFAAMRRQSH
jgi:hypothetical protein